MQVNGTHVFNAWKEVQIRCKSFRVIYSIYGWFRHCDIVEMAEAYKLWSKQLMIYLRSSGPGGCFWCNVEKEGTWTTWINLSTGNHREMNHHGSLGSRAHRERCEGEKEGRMPNWLFIWALNLRVVRFSKKKDHTGPRDWSSFLMKERISSFDIWRVSCTSIRSLSSFLLPPPFLSHF